MWSILSDGENKALALLKAVPDMIFRIDQNGIFLDYKADNKDLYVPDDKIVGKAIKDIMPEHVSLLAYEGLEKTLSTGEIQIFEYDLDIEDGETHSYECRMVKSSDSTVVAVVRDRTAQKREIQHVEQHKRMEALSHLAGGIAHDFNNQLAGMMGFAELIIQESGHNTNILSYAENIIESIENASSLTKQILAFSRQGKYEHNLIDIKDVIMGLLNRDKTKYVTPCHIDADIEDEIANIKGDSNQVYNALLHLVNNGCDAVASGGELSISAKEVNLKSDECKTFDFDIAPGRWINIKITDTGPGMTPDIIDRIFEPFFTTKTDGLNRGMGLAATYGIIKNHGGFIDVKSTPGKGSTFSIYLPPADNSKRDSQSDMHISDVPPHYSKSILFVEDDHVLCEVMAEMLKELGYSVYVQNNGQNGVNFYKKNWKNIDLVIMDMMMPVMGGGEAFIQMKKINPEISALISSGFSIDGEASHILANGAKGFIQKPYRITTLQDKINEILEK